MDIDVEELIGEVQRHPILWDTAQSNYRSKPDKFQAWLEIAAVLNEDFKHLNEAQKKGAVTDLSQKWKTVRDNYIRNKKKKAIASRAGAKRVRPYKHGWLLSFLEIDKQRRQRDTESSVENDDEEDVTSHHSLEFKFVPNEEEASAGDILPTASAPVDVMSTLTDFMETCKKQKSIESNEHLAFLYSLLPSLQQLNREQTFTFRMETMKLLENLRTGRRT